MNRRRALLGLGALAGVQRLFEAAMLDHSGADLAYYDLDSVAGRLRRGPIRTGDLYVLESWQSSVARVELKGSAMTPNLVEALRAAGKELDPRRSYAVATTDHLAREEAAERLGQVDAIHPGPLLRDVAIAHVKQRGFPSAG